VTLHPHGREAAAADQYKQRQRDDKDNMLSELTES